jgi:hypothetical protein
LAGSRELKGRGKQEKYRQEAGGRSELKEKYPQMFFKHA